MLPQIQAILRQIPPFKKVVVGVSGGADSVALALLLNDFGYTVTIAHLNHSLRGEASDGDEVFTQAFAKKLNVPCVTKKVRIPKKGNLEANARKARYTFLESVRKKTKSDLIAVAHHQNDQIETVLMNLTRGAGLRGLSGMHALSGLILRPFLEVTKREILDFLKTKKQDYRNDVTNADTTRLRSRLRHLVIPKIQKENPQLSELVLRLNHMAQNELSDTLQKAKRWIKINENQGVFLRENFQTLGPTLKAEVLFHYVGTRDVYAKNINKLIAFIETARTGKVMALKKSSFVIEYDKVRILKKAVTETSKMCITKQGVRWGSWQLKAAGRTKLFARPWQPGDRFQPAGMSGHKKVQDYFTDVKIPRRERALIPMIVNSKNEIISVGNLRWSVKGLRLKKLLSIQNGV